jgi:hypothetical protein
MAKRNTNYSGYDYRPSPQRQQRQAYGAYENPQGVIDYRYQNVGNILTALNAGIGGVVQAQQARKQQAEDILKQQNQKFGDLFTEEYLKTTAKEREFGGYVTGKDRNVVHEEVVTALTDIGDGYGKWLEDHPEATQRERTIQLDKAIGSMQLLRQDLSSMMLAKQEYDKAKQLNPGEVGAIVPGFNDNLIFGMNAMDSNDQDMHITRDPNGNWRFTVAKVGADGNAILGESTTIDMTDYRNKSIQSGGFWNTVEEIDVQPVANDLASIIYEKAADGSIIYNEDLTTTDSAGNTIVDIEALKTYTNPNDPTGKPIFETIVEDAFVTGPDALSKRSGYWRRLGNTGDFDETAYTTAMQEKVLDALPNFLKGPKEKKAPTAADKRLWWEQKKYRDKQQQDKLDKQLKAIQANKDKTKKYKAFEETWVEAQKAFGGTIQDREFGNLGIENMQPDEIVNKLNNILGVTEFRVEGGVIGKITDDDEFLKVEINTEDQMLTELLKADKFENFTAEEKEEFKNIAETGTFAVESDELIYTSPFDITEEETVVVDDINPNVRNATWFKAANKKFNNYGIDVAQLPKEVRQLIRSAVTGNEIDGKKYRIDNPGQGGGTKIDWAGISDLVLTNKDAMARINERLKKDIWNNLPKGSKMFIDGKIKTKS